MKKYELRKVSADVAIKDKDRIKEGFAMEYNIEKHSNGDSDLIKTFETLEEAREELKKYKTIVDLTSGFSVNFYFVEEYFIQEAEYNEDGEIINGIDIWEYSKME